MKKLLLLPLAALGMLCTPGMVRAQNISTFAGGIAAATGTGTNIGMGAPIGIARDAAGNIYVSDYTDNVVRKLTPAGVATVIAGTGVPGSAGDGGPATAAQLKYPWGVAVDAAGNVFIADYGNDLIRRVDAVTGIITRYAGWGPGNGNSQGGGTATFVDLTGPRGVAVDASGNLYISENGGNRIDKVTPGNHILTIIVGNDYGTGGFSGDGGQASAALISHPEMLLLDTSGNLYFGEQGNHRVRVMNLTTGIINTFAGNGITGSAGDSGLATVAQLSSPTGLARDANNNIYICDNTTMKIRKISATTGIITTIAGSGATTAPGSGDGGPALAAQLNNPFGIVSDTAGNIYIADNSSYRVRKVTAATGIITNAMGNGSTTYGGDGDPANNSVLNVYSPSAVNLDAAGNVYIGDVYRLRKVNATTNIISTIAGNGTAGISGDGGPATAAQFNWIAGTVTDASGNIYIADKQAARIRKIDTAGIVTTFAGTGLSGYSGDGGPATSARLGVLSDLAMSPDKSILYFTDGNTIRQVVLSTGIISTIAGIGGVQGSSGDGGLATAAKLSTPAGLAVDTAGNIYISDQGASRIRKITLATGIITNFAGSNASALGDGGPATAAKLSGPSGITLDVNGNLYIADRGNYRIRKIDASTGYISTISGTNNSMYAGDGGPASAASFWDPSDVVVDAAGHLYIADAGIRRVRTFMVPLAPSVRITASINNACAGTAVNFTATPSVGGSTPSYQWIVNGTTVSGATSATYSYVPANGDSVRCKLFSSASNATSATAASNTILMATVTSATPAVNITASQTSVCPGNAVTFTTAQTGGGTAPAYQWKINGNTVPGATAATYNYQPTNNDTVKCILTSNAICFTAPTAVSNNVVVTVNPIVTPTVNIAPSQSSVCSGAPVIYTAATTNGGSNPSYKWSINGNIVSGATDTAYHYTPANHDTVRCILTSNANCASVTTVTSVPSIMTVNPNLVPAVSIVTSANNICAGATVVYTATPTNGGAAPVYHWTVNGNTVSGATSGTYSYQPFNNDTIKCVLISSKVCTDTTPVSSNQYVMTVNPLITPVVNVTPSSNNICAGTPVTYMATQTNGGAMPAYQWSVNGSPVSGATSATYSYAPANNDTVRCTLTSNNITCPNPATVNSNNTIMAVNPIVTPAVSIVPSLNNICSGTPVTFTATVANAGSIPVYQWSVNGNIVTGTVTGIYSYTPANNDTVKCVLTSNVNCVSTATAISNDTVMTVNPKTSPTVTISSNVATSQMITFTATLTGGGANPQYQWRKNGTNIPGATTSTYFALVGTDVLNNDKISVWAANTDACGDSTVSGEMIITVVTGIDAIGSGRYPLSLFPNPNNGSFTIKGALPNKAKHDLKLEVYNTIGQLIHQETFEVMNGILERNVLLPDLPTGNYFLKVNDGSSAVIRFIVGR